MKGERMGEFEELVLLTVHGLGQGAYGVPIQQKLERVTARPVSIGAVYAALQRLEAKGYVRSRTGGASAVRGGRRKRFFRATAGGLAALRDLRRVRETIWAELDLRAPLGGGVR